MPVLFYNNGYKPAKCRDLVNAYTFGWIVPKVDIFIALNPDREPLATRLLSLRERMEDRVNARWGVERDPKHSPRVPEFDDLDDDHIRIILAYNKTEKMIDEIMTNKFFHDECRECFNNPKSMAVEPVWILSGLRRVPKGLYVPMESLPKPTKLLSFPQFYNNGAKPSKFRDVDPVLQFRTPSYIFGWIVKKVDMSRSLFPGEKPRLDFVEEEMANLVFDRWGVPKTIKYAPSSPDIDDLNDDYIQIILACNDTSEMIDEIMADKAYHDEVRECFNNPPSMAMEPVWILAGIYDPPKGLLPE